MLAAISARVTTGTRCVGFASRIGITGAPRRSADRGKRVPAGGIGRHAVGCPPRRGRSAGSSAPYTQAVDEKAGARRWFDRRAGSYESGVTSRWRDPVQRESLEALQLGATIASSTSAAARERPPGRRHPSRRRSSASTCPRR